MPIYEYECKNCGKHFDKMQSITADPLSECVHCGGGPIRRVLQPVGVIFKGSGWYINDSRKASGDTPSSKPTGDSPDSPSETGKTGGADTPPTASKTDSTPTAGSSE